MDDKATTIEMLFEKAENYTKTSAELLKLNAIDKSADILSSLLSRLAIITVVALFTLLLNIGVALWLGEILGKSYYGFFIVSGFYLIITAILSIFSTSWIKIPVSNFIITKMLKKR